MRSSLGGVPVKSEIRMRAQPPAQRPRRSRSLNQKPRGALGLSAWR
jgi:hypothetical protein